MKIKFFILRLVQTALKIAPLLVLTLIVSGAFAPTAHAATTQKIPVTPQLEISGWIPYWRTATGTADVLPHLETLTEVNPFGYSVKNDGTLVDTARIGEGAWAALFQAAKDKKVRFIPTVMWSDGAAIHRVLSNTKTRIALEDAIAALVKENNFSGIDIDFEGKYARTKNYFSTFLKGLSRRLGKKWLMCTIEARTPLDSRFSNIPKTIEYANDFVAINSYCDRVRIMTYDQQSIDLKLNQAAIGPYVPVADPKWVEKVMRLAAKTISKKKLVIGIPTYGYEYSVKELAEGYEYHLLWAFNPRYAFQLAGALHLPVIRNEAGELSFSYLPTSTASALPDAADTVRQSNNPALATTTFSSSSATTTLGTTKQFNILWWSDASAIKDKVALARKLGVRGVAIFKLDGGEDPAMWAALR